MLSDDEIRRSTATAMRLAGVFHPLGPEPTVEDALPPETDCERECFRHGGDLSCECEEGEAGTWHDGC